MSVDLRGATAVVLPGTGSDDDYIRRAFFGPLAQAGATLIAPRPKPEQLVTGYLDALNTAAAQGPIVLGGMSIGASVSVAWALRNPGRVIALLAAWPAWTGSPDGAPAALAARHTAQRLRCDGLAATVAQLHASSPAWLAGELTRSWTGQWPRLPDALEEAAAHVAPSRAELQALDVPMGVAATVDDPVHPLYVAVEWVSAAPRAALRTVTLDQIGADATVLGAACLAALADVL